MKNLLFAAAVVLVLGGFGCKTVEPAAVPDTSANGTSLKAEEKVEGVWHLTFNLPKDWVMVPQYAEDFEKPITSRPINSQLTDVVVQSTNKVIALTGHSDLPEGTFITDDYTYIRAFRMDKASIVPAEAEDIGNGFSRLVQGVNATFYMKGQYANYKFVVYRDNADLSVAENVVKSAKEVTDFVATP